jgi:hypothetical protein
MVAAFGFMPLIAEVGVSGIERLATKRSSWVGRDTLLAAAAAGLIIYHVLLPTSFARDEALRIRELTHWVHASIMQLDVDDETFPHQDLVLLAAPEVGTSMYLPLTRRRFGRSAPRACWYLSLTEAPYVLTRTATNRFTIHFNGSATALLTPHEQILRSPAHPFHVGDHVDLGPLRVTVLELLNHRPKTVSVEVDRPLDDRSLLFMVHTTDGYERYALPAVGDSSIVDMHAAPEGPNG